MLGADGDQEVGAVIADGCCPPLCVDPCSMACSFIQLLPSGPLWDRAKSNAFAFYSNSTGRIDCAPAIDDCPSLVSYAAYAGHVLVQLIEGALVPALREADTETATTTLDDWLERLGWENCFESLCRSRYVNATTPFEVIGPCGPVFYPLGTPPALQCAVKRGIVRALSRLAIGGIVTLDYMNWIIEPLGARVLPSTPDPACEPEYSGSHDCDCVDVEFAITNAGNTLPACLPPEAICGDRFDETVQAFIDRPLDAPVTIPARIYPGVLAAECIIRSLFPKNCPNTLVRITQ